MSEELCWPPRVMWSLMEMPVRESITTSTLWIFLFWLNLLPLNVFSTVNFRLVTASCSFHRCCFLALRSLGHVLLFATPWTEPAGSSVRGISQARRLEWVAVSYSRDLPDPGVQLGSLALAGGFFTTRATWNLKIECHKKKIAFM